MRFSLAFDENEISLPNELRTEKKRNPTTRCGAEFTANHLQKFRPIKEQCRSCGGTNHFARICKRIKTSVSEEVAKLSTEAELGEPYWMIKQSTDQKTAQKKKLKTWYCMQAGEKGTPPTAICIGKKRNNVTFTAIIDALSAITKLKQSDLRNLLKTDTLFLKPIPKREGIRRLQLATTTFIGLHNDRRPSGKENKKTSASRDNTRWQEFTYRTRLADKLERQIRQCRHE